MIVFGVLDIIRNPLIYFEENSSDLEAVVKVVRAAFGKELDFEDVYQHVTLPQEVCLLRDLDGNIFGMRSHNRTDLSGIPSLILEGAAIHPSFHGKGLYGKVLSEIYDGETAICLRTQNPRVYAGLEGFCRKVYPFEGEMPGAIKEIQKALAREMGCDIEGPGIVRGYYGGLFYDKEPVHEKFTPFFKETLGIDLYNGDALLVVGIK